MYEGDGKLAWLETNKQKTYKERRLLILGGDWVIYRKKREKWVGKQRGFVAISSLSLLKGKDSFLSASVLLPFWTTLLPLILDFFFIFFQASSIQAEQSLYYGVDFKNIYFI